MSSGIVSRAFAIALAFAQALGAGVPTLVSAATSSPQELRFTHDFQNTPLVEALAIVAGASRARLEVGAGIETQRVSMRLEAVSLEEAVRRLLRGRSYLIAYDRLGHVSTIQVLSSPASSESAASHTSPVAVPIEPKDPPDLVEMLDMPSPFEETQQLDVETLRNLVGPRALRQLRRHSASRSRVHHDEGRDVAALAALRDANVASDVLDGRSDPSWREDPWEGWHNGRNGGDPQ